MVHAEEMLEALRTNFEGREALRQRLLNLPKFGQDDPEADAMADRVLGVYTAAGNAHVTPHGDGAADHTGVRVGGGDGEADGCATGWKAGR